MNREQTNYRRMFNAVQEVLDEKTTKWNTIPVMVKVKNRFDELLQRTDETNEKTNPGSKKVTAGKEKLKMSLSEKMVVSAGILQAYAAFNNDSKLADKTKLTKSDLYNARETDIEKLANPVLKAAREHLNDLADYMLTDEMIVEAETTLDDFKALIGQPRHIRNQAYAAMTVLEELIDTTNALLKEKLDKLMIRFSVTDPEFYDAYLRARTIVD